MKNEHPDFPDPDNSIALDLGSMIAGILIFAVGIALLLQWW